MKGPFAGSLTGGAKARPPWAAGRAPTEQQRREGRGRCVRRVVSRCAEDAGEGARRLATEGGGSRRRRRGAWDCPSVVGRRRGGAADARKIRSLGPSLSASEGSGAAREMSVGAALGAGVKAHIIFFSFLFFLSNFYFFLTSFDKLVSI